jgi:hypothetical protein
MLFGKKYFLTIYQSGIFNAKGGLTYLADFRQPGNIIDVD